jgi:hypothetical protein
MSNTSGIKRTAEPMTPLTARLSFIPGRADFQKNPRSMAQTTRRNRGRDPAKRGLSRAAALFPSNFNGEQSQAE